MRHVRFSILAGTAVALVLAAATTAGANPNDPSFPRPQRTGTRQHGQQRASNMFAAVRCNHPLPRGADAAAELPDATAQRADHLDAECAIAPAAEPVNAPLRMVAPPAQTAVNQPAASPPAPAVSAPVDRHRRSWHRRSWRRRSRRSPWRRRLSRRLPAPAPMAAPVVAPPPVAAPAASEPPARVAAPSFTASECRRRRQGARADRQEAARAHRAAQERARRHRGALPEEPQCHAAVVRQRPAERARQRRDRASAQHRRRRPRPDRLSAAGRRVERRSRGRSRAAIHRDAADLRAPRHERPRAFQPRQPEHRLQGQLRRRRRDDQDRVVDRPAAHARRLQPAAPRLQGAARRSTPSCATRPSEPARTRIASGPVLEIRPRQERPRDLHARPARAAASRAARPAGRADNRYDRALVDAVAQVPEGQRHHRPTAS